MRFLLLFALPLYAEVYTHILSSNTWEELDVKPFQELVLSWNASRPASGRYTFFVSVRQNGEWSPWLYYAEWSSPGQIMFCDRPEPSIAAAYAGVIKPKTGECDAFRIQVLASGGAGLQNFYNLTVCATNPTPVKAELPELSLESVFLENVPRHSQFSARHPRYNDLSLPTAMTILVNHTLGSKVIQPGDFAERVVDDDTAFYENSSFNIAQASHYLKERAQLELNYLPDFAALHKHLLEGHPVVVFITGWWQGSPRPYRTEHAICIIGYDPEKQKVHALDPGYSNDKATLTSYDLADFLKGWAKQRNKAIILIPAPCC